MNAGIYDFANDCHHPLLTWRRLWRRVEVDCAVCVSQNRFDLPESLKLVFRKSQYTATPSQ
jgi:hypothetical protein